MKKDLITLRSQTVKKVREFFDGREYLEVQTPRLLGLPGQEPYLDPLWTTVHRPDGWTGEMALITSPEYTLKKMLGAGFDKVYDLGPCFRDNEPWDGSHDIEFLMLEWYRKNATLTDLMDETEALVRFVIQDEYVTKPFRRLTVEEALRDYAKIELSELLGNDEAMKAKAKELGQTVHDTDTWDDLFHKIFLSHVEHRLGWNEEKTEYQPTFLYRYPASQAALAKRDPSDERYALRVELYIGDLELCNGFEELSDPIEQRARFEEEIALRKTLGKKTWSIDEDLLQALPALGTCSGNAFGIDRLVMLQAQTSSIGDVMPLPIQKRLH